MSIYKKLMLVMMLFPIGLLFAQESSDSRLIRNVKIKDKDTQLHESSDVYVEWKIGVLMGEPVLNSKAIVSIPLNFRDSKQRVTYKGEEFEVPTEVVKKISVVSAKASIYVPYYIYMDFDLGAMGDIYWGENVSFLSKDKKERYFSFNVPGSPEWNNLFYKLNQLSDTREYLSEEESKKIFITGIDEDEFGISSNADVKFNLNPIKMWIESKIKNKNKSKKVSSTEKKDPFKKFEAMDISDELLARINNDIKSFIIERCGLYYTKVKKEVVLTGLHLYLDEDYSNESAKERKKREKREKEYKIKKAEEERRRAERVSRSIIEAQKNLPMLQMQWKNKRKSIKSNCRSYIMKKYAFEVSTKKLEELLNNSFTSTEQFEGIYYVPYDGY